MSVQLSAEPRSRTIKVTTNGTPDPALVMPLIRDRLAANRIEAKPAGHKRVAVKEQMQEDIQIAHGLAKVLADALNALEDEASGDMGERVCALRIQAEVLVERLQNAST